MKPARDVIAKLTVQIPRPPNFLRTAEGDLPIPVELMPPEDLRAIGLAWTNQLLAHAEERRKATARPPEKE